jgi:hypothetical protein
VAGVTLKLRGTGRYNPYNLPKLPPINDISRAGLGKKCEKAQNLARFGKKMQKMEYFLQKSARFW